MERRALIRELLHTMVKAADSYALARTYGLFNEDMLATEMRGTKKTFALVMTSFGLSQQRIQRSFERAFERALAKYETQRRGQKEQARRRSEGESVVPSLTTIGAQP